MFFLLKHLFDPDYVGEETPRVQRVRYGIDCIRPGLVGQIVGIGCAIAAPVPWVLAFWFCVMLAVLSTVLLVVGCRRNAWMKGYSPALGVLLGLLSLPGTLTVLLLVDRGSRIDQRRGFDVMMPKKVLTTWVTEESLTDASQRPRPWGTDEDRAKLWRGRDE